MAHGSNEGLASGSHIDAFDDDPLNSSSATMPIKGVDLLGIGAH